MIDGGPAKSIARGATPGRARAFLGLGSNIDPEENVWSALEMLTASPGLILTGISTLFRTPALSPPEPDSPVHAPPPPPHPDFLNGVLEILTDLDAGELEALLHRIEGSLGRVRTQGRYAPRPMDLDLLLYLPVAGEAHLPHPDVLTRAFVAHPLLELSPGLRLPPEGLPLQEVADRFPGPGGTPEGTITASLRSRFLSR
ncbi:2-amino-4-hydroxy-6-hydroxymethyldihydropteridine diphosphokinase [Gemmatimonadota bacterium]